MRARLLAAACGVFSMPLINRLPYVLEVVGATLESKKGGHAATDAEVAGALHFIEDRTGWILDVGANMGGWTTALLAREVRPRCLVMFEPQPICWSQLEKMESEAIRLEKCALSDREGALQMYVSENSCVGSAHRRSDFQVSPRPIDVPCTTLDSYVTRNAISEIEYIKMDIEGHELSALRGAAATMRGKIAKSISFEFGTANVDSRVFFKDFFECFNDYDYRLFRISHDGVPRAIRRYDRSLEYFNGVSNYVASTRQPKRFRE